MRGWCWSISKLMDRVFFHSGPIASLLINVFNCRLTMIIGGIFIFIGCASTYFAHSLDVALITYGIIAGKKKKIDLMKNKCYFISNWTRFFFSNLMCSKGVRIIHVYTCICTLKNGKSITRNFVNLYINVPIFLYELAFRITVQWPWIQLFV